MISIKTDFDYMKYLDDPSYRGIVCMIKRDCDYYAHKYKVKERQWVPRMLVSAGTPHKGSKISCGLLVTYQFQLLPQGIDISIVEIRLAENMDELLDLYNVILLDPTMGNKEKGDCGNMSATQQGF